MPTWFANDHQRADRCTGLRPGVRRSVGRRVGAVGIRPRPLRSVSSSWSSGAADAGRRVLQPDVGQHHTENRCRHAPEEVAGPPGLVEGGRTALAHHQDHVDHVRQRFDVVDGQQRRRLDDDHVGLSPGGAQHRRHAEHQLSAVLDEVAQVESEHPVDPRGLEPGLDVLGRDLAGEIPAAAPGRAGAELAGADDHDPLTGFGIGGGEVGGHLGTGGLGAGRHHHHHLAGDRRREQVRFARRRRLGSGVALVALLSAAWRRRDRCSHWPGSPGRRGPRTGPTCATSGRPRRPAIRGR